MGGGGKAGDFKVPFYTLNRENASSIWNNSPHQDSKKIRFFKKRKEKAWGCNQDSTCTIAFSPQKKIMFLIEQTSSHFVFPHSPTCNHKNRSNVQMHTCMDGAQLQRFSKVPAQVPTLMPPFPPSIILPPISHLWKASKEPRDRGWLRRLGLFLHFRTVCSLKCPHGCF